VIAEGFRLLPHLVKPLLAVPSHAVWLLATPDFRQAMFQKRGSSWAFLQKTSDPERALRNLLSEIGCSRIVSTRNEAPRTTCHRG
jgi:hypothetical protein